MAKRSKTSTKKRNGTRRSKRRWYRAPLLAGVACTLLLAAMTITLVLPWRWLNPPTTAFMWRAAAESQRTNAQQWLTITAMSPNIAVAVIASEDQLFFDHHGFDFRQIMAALNTPGGPRRGASTMTQQLAKNLYLWPGQSYLRKALEAWLTLAIEALWPKMRILEVYLNVAEFGPNIYGVGAGADLLLDTEASDLSPYQSALLAAVLPNPARMSARQPSTYVRQRAADIMHSVEQLGGPTFVAQH